VVISLLTSQLSMEHTALLISLLFLIHFDITEVTGEWVSQHKVICYIRHVAQASTRTVAVVSKSVTLGCVTMSGADPVWYFNEIPVTFTGQFEQVTGGIRINLPRLEHAGRYTCVDPNAPPTDLFTRDFVLSVVCKLPLPCSNVWMC